ncbi:MAG TPA: glycosyltransferase family 39 protein [Sedimentisphaerales bacterium]|nr:glycosyltransferase family 39 protein [Sedimentisphaerales bacterium]
MTSMKADYAERRDDILNVLILIAAASGLGVYLVATTVLISKDGVTYIELARRFSSEPLIVIKGLTPGYPKGLAFGYPSLILAAHTVAVWFGADSSVLGWTYSAQSMALLCRVLALIPLYFLGKLLVGAKRSFWALVILIVLPYPAQFGSDALRDWPHILFLAVGLLFLLRGAKAGTWWMFAGAGMATGFGHMIRPECGQLVIYGVLWILVRLIAPKPEMNRGTLVGALAALLLGFAIPAAPYTAVRGQLLPEKLKDYMTASALPESERNHEVGIETGTAVWTASGLPVKTVKAVGRLAGEMSDNLMYYFMPALLVGAYARIRRKSEVSDIEKFFIPAFVLLNVLMMIMLYHRWDYISRRHCLPLVVLLIFYVPAGLEILARWLEQRFSKDQGQNDQPSQRWFLILLAIGMGICAPKLLSPSGDDKQGYRDAAEWLRQNSGPEDVVAVPDLRISFYAERQGAGYTTEIPEGAEYIVRIVGDEDEQIPSDGLERKEFSASVGKRKKNRERVVIYRVT